MFLSGLVPLKIERPTRRRIENPDVLPKVGKKMTIIEAPAKYKDLPVELPQKDFKPSRPSPDPITLPGDNLSLLIGEEFVLVPKSAMGKLNISI